MLFKDRDFTSFIEGIRLDPIIFFNIVTRVGPIF